MSSFVFLFCVVNSMKLFAVWRKNKVQNWHGKRIESSACFLCLFITLQMYEKGKSGNKAVLHTYISGGIFFVKC